MKVHLAISTPECNHKAGALLQPYLCCKLQAHLLEHEQHLPSLCKDPEDPNTFIMNKFTLGFPQNANDVIYATINNPFSMMRCCS